MSTSRRVVSRGLAVLALLGVTPLTAGGRVAGGGGGSAALARAGGTCGDLGGGQGIDASDLVAALRGAGGLLQYDPRADVAPPFGLVTLADVWRLLATVALGAPPPQDCGGGPFCGDGEVDPGEECDDGAQNSGEPNARCREDCTLGRCGDGIVDGDREGCDPAGPNVCQAGASCAANCRCVRPEVPQTCGDGQVGAGEECDDGPANSNTTPDACREDCTGPRCGDGVVDSGEQCDPSGSSTCAGTARCSAVCLCEALATCGDGKTDPPAEECDDGAANSDSEPDACRTDCRSPRCGDGVVDADEECEPGVHEEDCITGLEMCAPAGAANECLCIASSESCGDGQVSGTEFCDPASSETREDDVLPPEACFPGDFCATVQDSMLDDGVQPCVCVSEVCGDGVVAEAGFEECEPGIGGCPPGEVCGTDCLCD